MNIAIDISNTTLQTERLILRPWKPTDLQDFYEYASIDGVGQMAGWLPHKSMEESAAILNMFISNKRTFAIEYAGKVVGSLGIDEYDEDEFPEFNEKCGCEIGYVLAKAHWGKGLMPEALHAVIHYLFSKVHPDFIICCHFTDNEQSKRVQEKCGFQHYRLIQSETRYGLVKDTWASVLYR